MDTLLVFDIMKHKDLHIIMDTTGLDTIIQNILKLNSIKNAFRVLSWITFAPKRLKMLIAIKNLLNILKTEKKNKIRIVKMQI